MPRDVREVYRRDCPPASQANGGDADNHEESSIVRTDWEILAQQTMEDRRRGKRVFLRFPVEVSGANREGKLFHENTFTTDISATGCRVALNEFVERGDTVTIKLADKFDSTPSAGTPHIFQVAWRERKDNVWTIGARKMTQGKIWHVEFPEKSPLKTS